MDVSKERTVSVFRVEECDKKARSKQNAYSSTLKMETEVLPKRP